MSWRRSSIKEVNDWALNRYENINSTSKVSTYYLRGYKIHISSIFNFWSKFFRFLGRIYNSQWTQPFYGRTCYSNGSSEKLGGKFLYVAHIIKVNFIHIIFCTTYKTCPCIYEHASTVVVFILKSIKQCSVKTTLIGPEQAMLKFCTH